MTIPAPTFQQNYARTPGILDPRSTFVRATTGGAFDRAAVLKTIPAGQPRWRWHPSTGVAQGMMLEAQRINLWLRSEELDNASNTKTSATISANSVAAPDGATTADTVTISGASGSVNQAVTVSAGSSITLSSHVKALATNFIFLSISDGTNTASAWFNLATGAVGTTAAGAGTVVYSNAASETLADGWYRIQLTVATATSTAFTGYIAPTSADNTASANTNSAYVWGMQVEANTAASTYIPTTTASVTRNGDVLMVPVGTSWFSTAEGTMLFEWVGRTTNTSGVWGGIGNTFADTIYLSRGTATQLYMTVLTSSVTQAQIVVSYANTDGTLYRAAMAWATNDFALCLNGAAPSTDAAGTVPTGIVRLGIGNSPWSASGGSQPGVPMRSVAYWPKRLSNAALQSITQ